MRGANADGLCTYHVQVLEVERERHEAKLAAEKAAAEAAAAAAAAAAPREYPYYRWGRWLVGMSANFKLGINDVLDDNLPSYTYLYHNGTVRRGRRRRGLLLLRTCCSFHADPALPLSRSAGAQARPLLHVLAPALARRRGGQGHLLRRRWSQRLRRRQPDARGPRRCEGGGRRCPCCKGGE